MDDIQRHPWYLKDLPPGVKEMNDNLPPPAPGLQVQPPAACIEMHCDVFYSDVVFSLFAALSYCATGFLSSRILSTATSQIYSTVSVQYIRPCRKNVSATIAC